MHAKLCISTFPKKSLWWCVVISAYEPALRFGWHVSQVINAPLLPPESSRPLYSGPEAIDSWGGCWQVYSGHTWLWGTLYRNRLVRDKIWTLSAKPWFNYSSLLFSLSFSFVLSLSRSLSLFQHMCIYIYELLFKCVYNILLHFRF